MSQNQDNTAIKLTWCTAETDEGAEQQNTAGDREHRSLAVVRCYLQYKHDSITVSQSSACFNLLGAINNN